jgi:hypothetical protein
MATSLPYFPNTSHRYHVVGLIFPRINFFVFEAMFLRGVACQWDMSLVVPSCYLYLAQVLISLLPASLLSLILQNLGSILKDNKKLLMAAAVPFVLKMDRWAHNVALRPFVRKRWRYG